MCFKLILLNVFLVISASCAHHGSDKEKVSVQLPKPGVVHLRIHCAEDTATSYALYVPVKVSASISARAQKGIAENHFFPLVIAFDPHGDGALPLTMYKELAEKYGFILMGSNDSKNGLPPEKISGIVTALMHEVHTGYPVDTNRIYLLGFSGGARVATMAAMYQVPVKGVVGCGAGFGGSDQPGLYKFDYFGMAGTADFNMNEMLQLEEPLTRAGFRHFITTFPGIHAWPPANVMEDGFCWLTLNAMKDGVVPKDEALIKGVIEGFNRRIEALKSKNQLIAAADACREAIAFMDGLASAGSFREELDRLMNRPEYQSQTAFRLKVLNKEEEEKQELMQALQSEDIEWWKKKISNLGHQTSKEELKYKQVDPEDTLKNRRLISFLSLFCYMNANAAVSGQDENAAVKIISIYEMADPANPEPNYMRAVMLARRSQNEAAIVQLNIAATKGFADKRRLTGQPEFQAMNSLPSWADLMKTVK